MAINMLDIKPAWANLAVRLQRLGKTQYINKCKLIRLTVICDEEGNPVIWSEPECTPIEPGNGAKEWLNLL